MLNRSGCKYLDSRCFVKAEHGLHIVISFLLSFLVTFCLLLTLCTVYLKLCASGLYWCVNQLLFQTLAFCCVSSNLVSFDVLWARHLLLSNLLKAHNILTSCLNLIMISCCENLYGFLFARRRVCKDYAV